MWRLTVASMVTFYISAFALNLPPVIYDVLRVPCYMLAALIFAWSGFVFYINLLNWKDEISADGSWRGAWSSATNVGEWRYLRAVLPLHVWRVAISYILLDLAAVGTLVSNTGREPVWFGLPLVLPAELMGVAALYSILQREWFRHSRMLAKRLRRKRNLGQRHDVSDAA